MWNTPWQICVDEGDYEPTAKWGGASKHWKALIPGREAEDNNGADR